MKKKMILALAVAAAAILLAAGYYAFFSPKAQSGSKSVTVEVVIADQGIDKTFHYQTDDATLADLLKDKQSDLGAQTEESSYGEFVSGMLGVQADASKEYYNIKVDGTDAQTGISQIPLEDGKTYTFTLTSL